jgi:2-hydroxychromene-2-carboxylate isomerase
MTTLSSVGSSTRSLTPIEFYFDPVCPWTWITSRWVREVAPHRDLDVTWRSYSLLVKNGDAIPEQYRDGVKVGLKALRVVEAARAKEGDEPIGDLYLQLGARIHHDGDQMLSGIADAVTSAGLDPTLVAAFEDESWDEAVIASTTKGRELVGEDVGVPIIVAPGRTPFFGPVMTPMATGEQALALWDALALLGTVDVAYEIKRSRSVGPEVGPRP